MKFDCIIGNPPYQEEQDGDNKTFSPPIYHKFMDESYRIADKVVLIHPARFLFNAGSTPKEWNQKMLNDSHFKVCYYQQDSKVLFPNTDIKGGIVVSYHDKNKNFGAIKTFTAFEELNTILKKCAPDNEAESLMSIVYIQNRFNLDELYKVFPEASKSIGSDGKDRRLEKNIFTKVGVAFSEQPINSDDIKVLGIVNNTRTWKYICSRYIDFEHENLEKYKVILPTSNGSGTLGETLSTPLIGEPRVAYTRSFIGIGAFTKRKDADNCLKYIKSKFCRTMLGILKITQDNNKDTWRLVPLQDFSSKSDIDWTQPLLDIDKQFYKKYGLSKKEIDFIETHVKEME